MRISIDLDLTWKAAAATTSAYACASTLSPISIYNIPEYFHRKDIIAIYFRKKRDTPWNHSIVSISRNSCFFFLAVLLFFYSASTHSTVPNFQLCVWHFSHFQWRSRYGQTYIPTTHRTMLAAESIFDRMQMHTAVCSSRFGCGRVCVYIDIAYKREESESENEMENGRSGGFPWHITKPCYLTQTH